ncbi:MAG: hydrolase [Fibrella sp.]|nr:hydrolase [Armatimonadota bacterium]
MADIVFVDVDDTLLRDVGGKQIPISATVRYVRTLHETGAEIYCWSSGGAAYARASAEKLDIADCFVAFLPKPQVMIDDQTPSEWRTLRVIHPNECA